MPEYLTPEAQAAAATIAHNRENGRAPFTMGDDTPAPEDPTPAPDGFGFRTEATAETIESVEAKRREMFGAITEPTTDVGTIDPDVFASYANEIRSFVLQFWAPPSEASLDFLVLWIIATHLRGRNGTPFLPETFPLLFLGSTGPASGKSTALKIAAELSCRGRMMADVTGPAMLNHVDGHRASLFLDEMDTKVGAGAGPAGMRAQMLASYETGGSVSRAMGKGETRDVDVHYPIAYAGMVRTFMTHPTLAALRTRTIMLHCRPNLGQDAPKVIAFRVKHRAQAVAFREVMTAWGLAMAPRVVADAEHVEMPSAIVNRDRQLWEVLFSLAEAIGGDWRDRCEAACAEIVQGTPGEDALPKSPVEWLLRDLAHVWTPGAARMASADIVTGLLALPDSPWARWLDAKPDNPAVSGGKQLARMLADRNGANGEPVRPKVMKIGGVAVRGFAHADLVAAGMPDLPAPDSEDNTTPVAKAPVKRARKRNPAPRRAPGGPSAPITSV